MTTHAARMEEARDMADDSHAFDLADFDIDPKFRHLTAGRWEHYRTCGVCQGLGSVTANRSHNNDPQADVECQCPNPDCIGGYVTTWTDPLLRLKAMRGWTRRTRSGAKHYQQVRAESYGQLTSWHQYRMCEAAIRMDVAGREALAAWRLAA